MLVSDIMSPNTVTISPDESAALAARLLYRHNIGSLPVCGEDGRLRGIVTDRDIVLRCVATESDPAQTPIKEIMSKNVLTVSDDDDVRLAARLMASEQVRRLPVIRDGQVVGMVSLGDMAKTNAYDMEAAKALSDISANIKKR